MKIIKYSIGIIVGLSLLMSCNDVMDTKPLNGQFDKETVWGSGENIEAFIVGTYGSTVGLYQGGTALWEAFTPNGVHSEIGWTYGLPKEDFDRYLNTGFGYFGTLRKCNMIIENSQISKVLSQEQKNEFMGEGYFLRALVYFYQARKQGRFVPINKVVKFEDKDMLKTPLTKSPKESYKLIMSDIDKAIENLPESSEGKGRANKYVALAFKSRMALQAYAYTNDATYLDKAIDAANKVINSGKYTLDKDYEGMFSDRGAYSSPEIILAYYRSSKNTTVGGITEMQRTIPNIKPDDLVKSNATPILKNKDGITFECWGTFFPTQNLVDQYLVIDQQDGKAKRWDKTSQYLNSVVEEDPSSLKVGDFNAPDYKRHQIPDENDMGSTSKGNKIIKYGRVKDNSKIHEIIYNHRDKRMDATVVRDSTVWLKDELVTLCVQGNLWAGVRDREDSWYTTCTNYYWRKGVYDIPSRAYYGNKIDYHYVIIRLGEVYMNLAEAYLLKGDLSNAVQALNVTRTTHGELPASTASSEKEVWEDYMRERRVEMAYEGGDIYWTLLRWGKHGGFANNGKAPGSVIDAFEEAPLKIQITKDRKRFFIGQVTRHNIFDRKFTPKRYLFPIPQGELDKRAAFGIVDSQNPGW